MFRAFVFASAGLLTASVAAQAQSQSGRSVYVNPRAGTLNEHHITSTGATVPNPGASQAGGTTPLDIGIQRRDDAIDGSLCRGC